jgi:hypothetical protein
MGHLWGIHEYFERLSQIYLVFQFLVSQIEMSLIDKVSSLKLPYLKSKNYQTYESLV